MYFSRQWQDTLMLSLSNLFSLIYSCLPQPKIADFHSSVRKIRKLREENDMYKDKLQELAAKLNVTHDSGGGSIRFPAANPPEEIMDDFFIIAAEAPAPDSQVKSIKNFLRNITGGGSSSVLSSSSETRKSLPQRGSVQSVSGSSLSSSSAGKQPSSKSPTPRVTASKTKSSHAPVKRVSICQPESRVQNVTIHLLVRCRSPLYFPLP